ncbi:hypothetical protein M0208_06620 [Sphingomonas sp. SUN019]|uniref:hypothetical protein n=1 Tax=Sphingomonas sp. SUN019 TaxID=2937788 RepID=UPI0021649E46|nr:hypothetical protein [Sphingomonas sp. SUN019]UVO50210.1 hypothetical protein M0208_06620 [Sphingomonas sp. SUN019]
MASITTFSRLEPQPLRSDLAAGAAAPVHDPLWLLARQWQVGEFAGHDGGNPIVARWRGVAAPPTRFVAGPIPPNTALSAPRFAPDAAPLEAIIERVTVPLTPETESPAGLRLAIDAGRHFLALLARQRTSQDYRADFVARYALEHVPEAQLAVLDSATASYARLHAGRSPDGRRLLAELAGRDVPRIDRAIDPGDIAEVREASAFWRKWLGALFHYADPEAACWQPARFEYTASLAGRRSPDQFGESTLTAHRYDRDTVDWYEFDVNGEVNLGTQPAEAGAAVTRTVVPAPVTAPGLPATRFWEFEDGRLNIAAIHPASTDLAQVLLVETLSGYGNDWYVIGVDLPVGRLIASSSLVVVDTFGAKTLLQPAGVNGTSRWGLFRHAMPADSDEAEGAAISNLLYLAPRLAQPLIGPVVEQVTLTRDEQANIAWAIEQMRESPLQAGVPLSDARPAELTGDPQAPPQYRLFRHMPPQWVPLLPIRAGPDEQIMLARGSVSDEAGGGQPVGSVTAILAGDGSGALLIPEEEVPDDGLVVQRHYQAARWSDGTLHVWAAYRARPAGSLPSANLRFDTVGV